MIKKVVNSISEAVYFLYENGPENYRVFITHGGVFHADDVCATALLLHETENLSRYSSRRDVLLVRANCTKEEIHEFRNEFCGMGEHIIAYDVAKVFDPNENIFDHHQDDAPCDPDDNHKFAAVGQLWHNIYGFETGDLLHYVYVYMKKNFFNPVDIQDNNGKPRNMFSDIIKGMNVQWNSYDDNNNNFLDAVKFAYMAYNSERKKATSMFFAEDLIKKCIEEIRPYEGGGSYIIDEDNLPPQKVFNMRKAAFLVQPSTYEEGKWQVTARPGLGISYAINEEDGCTFVHQKRFLATYNSKEAAVAAAEANLLGKLQERLAKEANKGA